MTTAEIAQKIGDPRRIADSLRQFEKDTQVLSDQKLDLVAQYPQQWIAIYNGEVRADSPELADLMIKIEDLGLPRDRVVVRFMSRSERQLIL